LDTPSYKKKFPAQLAYWKKELSTTCNTSMFIVYHIHTNTHKRTHTHTFTHVRNSSENIS